VDASDLLIAAVQELSLARDMDAIAGIVRRTARRLTGADGATFILREGNLCRYVDEDAIGPLWKGRSFPLDACVSGMVMQEKQSVVIPDIYADARIPVDAYRPTFVKSLVVVPIRTLDPIGAIGNYWADKRTAGEDEVELLQTLADATAAAVEGVRLQRELEQRVRDRTSALEAANRRLSARTGSHDAGENQSGAEDLKYRIGLERDQLTGILASGIAHELSQPLTAATIYTDAAMHLLRQGNVDHDLVINTVQKAAAQNQRAVEAVCRFREILKRDSPGPENADIGDIIHSAVRLLEAESRDRGYAIGMDVSEEIDRVMCDRVQIEHVIVNLLRNALEAMSEAGISRGSARIRARPGHDDTVHIIISDDGPGIDAGALENLFRPLYTTKEGGLGMSLFVSQTITQAHGGELWAENGDDGGAVFHLILPASGERSQAVERRAS